MGITFCGYGNGNYDDRLTATADASFGERCVLAHYLKMNGAAFDHSITSNKTVMLSTTEAELNAAARCGRAVMGYRNLMDEMPGHYRQDGATPVEGDCGPCITICNNPGALSDATRHMKRSAMYMRELVSQHQTTYTWTPTRTHVAIGTVARLRRGRVGVRGVFRSRDSATGTTCSVGRTHHPKREERRAKTKSDSSLNYVTNLSSISTDNSPQSRGQRTSRSSTTDSNRYHGKNLLVDS